MRIGFRRNGIRRNGAEPPQDMAKTFFISTSTLVVPMRRRAIPSDRSFISSRGHQSMERVTGFRHGGAYTVASFCAALKTYVFFHLLSEMSLWCSGSASDS